MRVFLGSLIATLALSGVAGAQPITITSIGGFFPAVAPFSTVLIEGTGFQPATTAISVLILPDAGAFNFCAPPFLPDSGPSPDVLPIAVPVYEATSTTLKIVVPPVVDAATGELTTAQVTWHVVQVSEDTVWTSQRVSESDGAPCIERVPLVPPEVPAGAVTRAFLNLGLDALSDTLNGGSLRASLTPTLTATLTALKTEQEALVSQVTRIVNDPDGRIPVATVDELPFVLDAETLATTDRLIVAHLEHLVAELETHSFARYGGTVCRAQADVTVDIQSGACKNLESTQHLPRQTREEIKAKAKGRVGQLLTTLGNWRGTKLGSLTTDAGAALATADEYIKAQQLLLAGQVAYLSVYAALSTVPEVPKPLTSIFATILTTALFEGTPVTAVTKKAADVQASVGALATDPSPSPQGGVILTAETPPDASQGDDDDVFDPVVGNYRLIGPPPSPPTVTERLLKVLGKAEERLAATLLLPSRDLTTYNGVYEGNFFGTHAGK